MTNAEAARAWASGHGYGEVWRIMRWQGHQVYEEVAQTYGDAEEAEEGLPVYILARHGEARMAEPSEALEIMAKLEEHPPLVIDDTPGR